MKFAAAIIAYNEESMIEGCLDGLVDIPVFVSLSSPWQGVHRGFDRTHEIALRMGATVFSKNFKSESDQRNYLMEKIQLAGYDYAFIIDADEYYTREGIKKAMEFIEKNPDTLRFNVGPVVYFWKNTEWEIVPKYNNVIPACYRADVRVPKSGNRNFHSPLTKVLPADTVMYHFSYAGKDDRILNKLEHFSHANEMDPAWFKRVWKQWTPEMQNLCPRKGGEHAYKRAIPFECPEDIKHRFMKGFLMN